MAPSVREFYEGKSILITGVTGFVGKVLIEKYLRSCPGIKVIYLLMRSKKGVSSADRLEVLLRNLIFNGLKEKQPNAFKKLKLIQGDVLEEGLGLSADDQLELRRNCNIIIHSAANVRFDQKLKDAVNINVAGTNRLLKLAASMESLEAFVHISTSYSRYKLDVLEEKLYPPVHKPRKIMDIVEWMDDKTLEHLEPKLIESEPNTYSYTKAITEDLVAEYCGKFPIAIGRPSIVMPAWKEPVPGWVDNMNGATGLIVGSGKGVIRTMLCEPSYVADGLPVDVIANGCILIAYETGLYKSRQARVFNMTLSGAQTMTWEQLIKTGDRLMNRFPFTEALWYPGGELTSSWLRHQLMLLFTHLIPAYFVDFLLFLFRKKPFLVRVQRRVIHGLNILQYYTIKDWHFKNTNFLALQKRLNESENEIFYTDVSQVDDETYFRNYVLGVRQYVVKEDPANLPRARRLHRIRYVVHVITKIIMYGLLGWLLYTYSTSIISGINSLDNSLRSFINC